MSLNGISPPAAAASRAPGRPLPLPWILLGLTALLGWETWQVFDQSRRFAPNLPSERGNQLRRLYWPDAHLDDRGGPLADWIGLADWLEESPIPPNQADRLRGLVVTARAASQEALAQYGRLLMPLRPGQVRKVLAPQPGVVDHRALGLDSSSSDLIFCALDALDRAAAGAAPAPSASSTPLPVRLPLERLGASIAQLIGDPEEPLEPGQAAATLGVIQALRRECLTLHRSHQAALATLTPAQQRLASARPLRRAEWFPAPFTLEALDRRLETLEARL